VLVLFFSANYLPKSNHMKNTLRLILGGFSAVAFVVAAHAADLSAGAFSANMVVGNVTYKAGMTGEYAPLATGTILHQGAVIKTGAESSVSIEFSSGATAMVRPNTEIEVAKFEQALFSGDVPELEEPAVSNTVMNLLSGEVVSSVKKLKTSSEYVVNSPIGAAGVRGTFFSVVYDPVTKTMKVSTLFGSVRVSVPNGTIAETANTDEQVIVNNGQLVKASLPDDLRQYLIGLINNLRIPLSLKKHLLKVIEHSQVGVSLN
jgi:hypothetical protein